jgi:hypothetical protein
MNGVPKWKRVAVAVLIGMATTVTVAVLQPHFKAGSIPDGICELLMLPGKLAATPFPDRGTASAEFLWRSRVAGALVLSVLAWLVLPTSANFRRGGVHH